MQIPPSIVITATQALAHNNIAFHQLLKPLSRHEFEGLTKQHHAGQKQIKILKILGSKIPGSWGLAFNLTFFAV
jgi:hypothetical protein